MKLYAPTNTPIHISLTSGHATLITQAGTEVDRIFLRDALDKGCLTEPAIDSVVAVIEKNDDTAERHQAIKEAINIMLDSTEEGNFTASGKPNLFKLSELAGFKVSKEAMETVFAELNDEK